MTADQAPELRCPDCGAVVPFPAYWCECGWEAAEPRPLAPPVDFLPAYRADLIADEIRSAGAWIPMLEVILDAQGRGGFLEMVRSGVGSREWLDRQVVDIRVVSPAECLESDGSTITIERVVELAPLRPLRNVTISYKP